MKGHQLWIASGNPAKTKELVGFSREFFPESISVNIREPKDVVENEPTFEGNAKLKAFALVHELINEGHQNFLVLADDSGLCVDLLDGSPGVFSGRYAGQSSSNSKSNLEKLLHDLEPITLDVKKRTGRYVCALYVIQVSEGKISKEFAAEGMLHGLISTSPKGVNGYAYDSIFLAPETLLSYGEISYEEKQRDSHRRRAFQKLHSLMEGR